MSSLYLSIGRLERRLRDGSSEEISFSPGVNLLVGPPNTGKTKWLQTLDYLLGDLGENPFEGAEEEGLAEKYEAAGAELVIGAECLWVERRWREAGAKGKVFVDGKGMTGHDFQDLLLEKLGIPLLHFPKGNPLSGQTWPVLSFRMILRHIYRRQVFWGGIADQQPEGEQHACLMQFLGIAERLFTADFGELVKLKRESEQLRARRDQYKQTLDELARGLLAEPEVSVGASVTTVRNAEERLDKEMESLRERRVDLLTTARDKAIDKETRNVVEQRGDERAKIIVELEELRFKSKAIAERLNDIRRYLGDLTDEIDRMGRASDAGNILADLKVTHCPACDQPVSNVYADPENCFLCHKHLPEMPLIEGLGTVRLQFEVDRLKGEQKEAYELLDVLQRDAKRLGEEIVIAEERFRMLENELVPARQAVASLVQEEISAMDMRLGELNERQRQLGRISAANQLGQQLTDSIAAIERDLAPLEQKVVETARSTDFDAMTALLEDGINTYLSSINILRPGVWRHSPVNINLSGSSFTIRVGARRWQSALGGTDSLYFLMAYHYGLLTLSDKVGCHYPGLCIIDVPGEFSGEAIEDKEDFIVQPFIELLSKNEFAGAQLIITGATFAGLRDVHRLHQSHVYVI